MCVNGENNSRGARTRLAHFTVRPAFWTCFHFGTDRRTQCNCNKFLRVRLSLCVEQHLLGCGRKTSHGGVCVCVWRGERPRFLLFLNYFPRLRIARIQRKSIWLLVNRETLENLQIYCFYTITQCYAAGCSVSLSDGERNRPLCIIQVFDTCARGHVLHYTARCIPILCMNTINVFKLSIIIVHRRRCRLRLPQVETTPPSPRSHLFFTVFNYNPVIYFIPICVRFKYISPTCIHYVCSVYMYMYIVLQQWTMR